MALVVDLSAYILVGMTQALVAFDRGSMFVRMRDLLA